MKLLIVLLFLVSCAKVKLDDSSHKVKVTAETTSYVIVRFEFIRDIKEMCTDIHPEYETEDEVERKRLISQCTLDKMTIVDLSAIEKYNTEVCKEPKTEQEIDICRVLSFTDSKDFDIPLGDKK